MITPFVLHMDNYTMIVLQSEENLYSRKNKKFGNKMRILRMGILEMWTCRITLYLAYLEVVF